MEVRIEPINRVELPRVASVSLLSRCPVALYIGTAGRKCPNPTLAEALHFTTRVVVNNARCERGVTRISSGEIMPGVRVVAQPDYICVSDSGDVFILELKFCRDTAPCSHDPLYLRQMSLYLWVFTEASHGYVVLVRDETLDVVDVLRIDRNVAERVVRMIVEAWEKQLPMPSFMQCTTCFLSSQCTVGTYFAQKRAHAVHSIAEEMRTADTRSNG